MSLWGKILSRPKTVLETGSIKVVDKGKERRLIINGSVQSVYPLDGDWEGLKDSVWGMMTAVERTGLSARPVLADRVLILGLGGGTVAHLLTQKFGPIPITGVEIDPEIVKIGREYFGLDQLSNLKIIADDAIKFINNRTIEQLNNRLCHLIIVDLYPECESNEFLAGLARFLDPKGLIIFNRGFFNRQKRVEAQNFLDKLKAHFAKIETEIIPGKTGSDNLLIFCQKK